MKLNWKFLSLLLLQGSLIMSTSGKYINTPCDTHTDCGLNNHLQCINNVCQCETTSQIYDGSTHKCLLLAGQQCHVEHDYQYNRQHSIPIKCVPHADCTKSVCRCKPGYRFSPDFLCKPDFGSPCYEEADCDESLGLICTNRGICDCFNSTWTYQGQFGCVDPNNPTFHEMLRLLNQTDRLLKENNLELKDMFNDLGLQNEPNSEESGIHFGNILAERQFQQQQQQPQHDTYNTNDLQFAAQNQNPQQSGGNGFNFQQLLTLFQTFQSLIPRNQNGGGGFFRNLFGGGNNQGGYPDSSTTPASTYGPPGKPEMGQRMGLLNSFINLFNQMIPIVRQLRMRFMPLRFFRNLLNRFSPSTTAAPPPAAEQHNPPPTVIQSSGNFQNNPLFSSGQAAPPSQGSGSFRFFMRTRERFRNFLRGNNQGGGGSGGYNYPPGNSYGAPPPPADGAEPTSGGGGGDAANDGGDAPPPPAPAPEGSNQQNIYLNNHQNHQHRPSTSTPNRAHFHEQQNQVQYSTIHAGGHQAIPPAHPTQRNQNFGSNNGLPRPATFNSGSHNHASFFDGRQPQNNNNNNNQQNFQNNQNNHNNNQFNNAQATSHHHQSTFVANNHQSQNIPQSPRPPQHSNHGNFHTSTSNSRPPFPSIGSVSPPPIPQIKLQFPEPHRTPISTHENLSDNFILSEADDPHPGFTPHSSPPPALPQQESYRTSARFERIGRPEHHNYQASSIAQNWRETF